MGAVGDLVVKECKSSEFLECDIVFSGLDSNIAGEVGELYTSTCFRQHLELDGV